MEKQKIAVLGSNSHIAKGLIYNFLQKGPVTLYLFTRSSNKVVNFLRSIDKFPGDNFVIRESYRDFMNHRYDVIINCVGIGAPNKLGNNFSDWFMVTEKFDNLAIKYLCKYPAALYINFSSGAVYGNNGSAPVEENTANDIQVNHISTADFYSIANLNAEAKHRSFGDLKIVDLRIFTYFSRFVDLDSGYLITEILNCVQRNKLFKTNDTNIVRDYIHPDDLFALVLKCINQQNINDSFDVASAQSIDKKQMLDYFVKKYELKYEISQSLKLFNPNGSKNIYYSKYNKFATIGFKPTYSSLDTISLESKYILSGVSALC